jgi:hypothetical protein
MTEYALKVCETTARIAFSILHLGVADTTKDDVPHAGRVSDVQPRSSTSSDTNSTRKPAPDRPNEHVYRQRCRVGPLARQGGRTRRRTARCRSTRIAHRRCPGLREGGSPGPTQAARMTCTSLRFRRWRFMDQRVRHDTRLCGPGRCGATKRGANRPGGEAGATLRKSSSPSPVGPAPHSPRKRLQAPGWR